MEVICYDGCEMLTMEFKKKIKIKQRGPTKRYLKDMNVSVVTLLINIIINNNDENIDDVLLFEFHFVISA